MVTCPGCGHPTRRRPNATQPDRCIACSLAAFVAYEVAAATPGTPEHQAAVAAGHLGGRPRKVPEVHDDQLTLF